MMGEADLEEMRSRSDTDATTLLLFEKFQKHRGDLCLRHCLLSRAIEQQKPGKSQQTAGFIIFSTYKKNAHLFQVGPILKQKTRWQNTRRMRDDVVATELNPVTAAKVRRNTEKSRTLNLRPISSAQNFSLSLRDSSSSVSNPLYFENLQTLLVDLKGMDLKEAVKDMISWDGTLSSSDFSLSACTFSEKWKMFNPSFPPWLWIPCPNRHLVSSHKVEGYLSLENMCLIKSSEEEESNRTLTWKVDSNISQKDEPIDYATLECPEHEVNYYDFHIVYSPSYRVPVLYFRSYYSDGQPLLLNEIEKDLPGHSAKLLSESKWTFITQEEHPYLNRPWYKLHPCGTSEWMKLLFHSDTSLNKNGLVIEQYLVSWFSVIGQVIGLKIPFGMMDK